MNPHTLDAYVTEKVRNQNNINKASILNLGKNAINTKVNINSKNTKITSDGVLIAQGTNDLPDSRIILVSSVLSVVTPPTTFRRRSPSRPKVPMFQVLKRSSVNPSS